MDTWTSRLFYYTVHASPLHTPSPTPEPQPHHDQQTPNLIQNGHRLCEDPSIPIVITA